jgi:hypothetical protein
MKIEQITADETEVMCRQITADLPEYFGLSECNEFSGYIEDSVFYFLRKNF